MSELHFIITADNADFISAINEIKADVQDASRQIKDNGGDIDKFISKIKSGVNSLWKEVDFKDVARQVIAARGEVQQLELNLTAMLGSAGEADALMSRLMHTAATTPLDLQSLGTGAKTLMAYGIETEEVNGVLIQLGNIASGLGIPFEELARLYGETISKEHIFMDDLQQFRNQGIPIVAELAKQMGVTSEEVEKLATAGNVSADEFKTAISSMTAEGSQFGGMMEAQRETINGKIAIIEDAVNRMFNEIGESSEGLINLTLDTTGKIVENWQSVLLVLADVAAAYGAQKAWAVMETGFNNAATNFAYDTEIAGLQALLPLKAAEQQTALQQAVAEGRLTQAKAEQVLALRAEAEAYMETLAAKVAEARQAEIAAQANLTAAYQEKEIADKFVESCEEKIDALYDLGDTIGLEAAEEELAMAKTMQAEAVDTLASASKEAKAASSAHVAAQQELENVTTGVNTAQTAGNTAATGILTIAKEKLALAVAKVNDVMKANAPALLAASVIALSYAIYKLATEETVLEASQRRLNESYRKAESAASGEAIQVKALFDRLRQAKEGSEEYDKIKKTIYSKYGDILNKIGGEKDALHDLARAYGLVTEEIRNKAKAQALDAYLETESQKYLKIRTLHYDLIYEQFKNKKGEKWADAHAQDINDVFDGKKVWNKNFLMQFDQEVEVGGGDTRRKKHVINIVTQATQGAKQAYADYAEDVDRAYNRFGISRDAKNGSSNTPEITLQQAYSHSKKDYEEALARVAKMNKERASFTVKEYEAATEDLKAKKEAFEKLGGETKSGISSGPTAAQIDAKEESAAAKLSDIIRKQAVERLRIEKDYETRRWQSRIDLMDEGEAKVLEQMNLNYDRQLTELKRQEEAEVEAEMQRQMAEFNARQEVLAAADTKYTKRTFSDSDIDRSEFDKIEERYKALFGDLKSAQEKAEADRLEASKEAMDAYLKEFGNYQQKRMAIGAEYEKKISEARNDGERMMLIANRNKALSDLDYGEWVDTGTIALAFGDISKLSEKTVSRLISDMEKYRDKVIATFDPDKIQKYEEALASLRKTQSDNSFGIFSSVLPDYFKERKSTANRMDIAGKDVNALYEKRAEIYNRIITLHNKINEGEAKGEDVSAFKAQLLETEVELDANSNSVSKAHDAFRLLQEEWNALDTPQAKFEALCGVIGNVSDLVGDLANQAAGMCEALGAEGLGEALGYLGDAMNSVNNIASGFAKGGLVGGIAAVAGEVMGWIGKIFTAGDNRKQKEIERLQEQIDALDQSYDRLGKALDKAYSTDASDLIDQQNTLLEQQQALIRQQMEEEEAKKKTDDEKMKKYREQLDDISDIISDNKQKAKEAIIGEDLKSAISDFASLYAEAWDDGTDAAQKSMAAVRDIISSALTEMLKKNIQPAAEGFYDMLANAMADGILTDAELDALDALKRQIDAMAASSEEQYKLIQERYRDLDELKEELTHVSFDSVRDSFKSKLADMSASAKDFSDDFSDMLRDALIEGLMNEKYDLMLREWYDEFAEAMRDKTLTDSERDALRQQYDSIVQQGIADRETINSIVGGGAYSQEATSGGWQAMGQDTADQLNGRFTALTELNAINNSLVAEGNVIGAQILDTLRSFSTLSMVTDAENPALREIRDMMFLSTGHLEDIAKHSKQLVTINSGIERLNNLINQRL